MKNSGKWVVLLVMALPGYFACSCSGVWSREFRDAVLTGTADAVQAAAFDFMAGLLPQPNGAE